MHLRLLIATCASAMLLSVAACSDNDRDANNRNANSANPNASAPNTAPNATGTSGAAEDNNKAQPITVTGCLQKGDGSNFILTQINEPSAAGVPAEKGESKVEREDLNAAEHAYRLNADNDKDELSKLVGRQVRVSGTLAKKSDLPDKIGTSGTNDRDNPPKLHESDLAQVDVSNVQQVAASCGAHATKGSSKSRPRAK